MTATVARVARAPMLHMSHIPERVLNILRSSTFSSRLVGMTVGTGRRCAAIGMVVSSAEARVVAVMLLLLLAGVHAGCRR